MRAKPYLPHRHPEVATQPGRRETVPGRGAPAERRRPIRAGEPRAARWQSHRFLPCSLRENPGPAIVGDRVGRQIQTWGRGSRCLEAPGPRSPLVMRHGPRWGRARSPRRAKSCESAAKWGQPVRYFRSALDHQHASAILHSHPRPLSFDQRVKQTAIMVARQGKRSAPAGVDSNRWRDEPSPMDYTRRRLLTLIVGSPAARA